MIRATHNKQYGERRIGRPGTGALRPGAPHRIDHIEDG
jgi:hypothetical protein